MHRKRNILAGYFLLIILFNGAGSFAQRQMEWLDRGVVGTPDGNGNIFVSWRLLATDPSSIAFNVYRSVEGGAQEKINKKPIADVTSLLDEKTDYSKSYTYSVSTILDGKETKETS